MKVFLYLAVYWLGIATPWLVLIGIEWFLLRATKPEGE